ncbi:hypothetical protein M427DRAFT_122297 [Gonapodya prolifera JEL478]|uniref:BAR domain-containing protein n=1 Tax=Gonapodya prolifera (strain JEL478) TaxID=1344416 RepID=A0A139ALD6_GONPJ|nr:hypothetical protein M427DRAFT_122297 [Gonapodya prolifera JEL478]|eukprot:KXS17235.1 hypothetical protein M427DRAFT_122297 [Gonapodya prolifera JEL478]
MSWSGFKKAVNRATTQVMQSTGIVEKTVDKEFDDAERNVKTLHAKFEKIHRDSKALLDSYKALSTSHTRLSASFAPQPPSSIYPRSSRKSLSASSASELSSQDDESIGIVAARCAEAAKEITDIVDHDVTGTLNATHLNPLHRLTLLIPNIDPHLEKRRKRLLDYDAQRARVRRALEKSGNGAASAGGSGGGSSAEEDDTTSGQGNDTPRVQALKADLERLKDECDRATRLITEDVAGLVAAREAYMDPIAEAGVRVGESFALSLAHLLITAGAPPPPPSDAPPRLEDVTPSGASERENMARTLEHKMRELSICGAGA